MTLPVRTGKLRVYFLMFHICKIVNHIMHLWPLVLEGAVMLIAFGGPMDDASKSLDKFFVFLFKRNEISHQ